MKKPLLAVIGLTTFLGVSFAAPKPMLYTGEIEKDGANFILLNTTTKVAYQLDNQKKAKDFAGDKVIVIGSLDETTTTIHLKRIDTAPGNSINFQRIQAEKR
jgi:hypothetical protein